MRLHGRFHVRIRTGVLAAATTTLALAGALLAQPAPASAAPPSYVALGDSYSSGVGTRSYLDDGTDCQRSSLAYPSLLATSSGYDLNFRACSGATIPDVTGAQLSALGAGTSYVTISVGGNDAGFADVLTECAFPAWASDCDAAVDGAQGFVDGPLPGSLAGLYSSIGSAAPNAQVVVVGYPRIFMGEDCNAATFFSPEEEARLNAMADLLNAKLAAAASGAGFSFADPTSAFVGHAVCDDPEWLNGFSSPVSDSYHPNQAGHASGYAPLVAPVLTGAGFTMNPGVKADALASAGDLAAEQRGYAGQDAGIRPQVFSAPDLDSPRVRKAAKAHGIDLDQWVAHHGGAVS